MIYELTEVGRERAKKFYMNKNILILTKIIYKKKNTLYGTCYFIYLFLLISWNVFFLTGQVCVNKQPQIILETSIWLKKTYTNIICTENPREK